MNYSICQSCGFPFTKNTKGINWDLSKNEDYCIGCFNNGQFTDRSLTMHRLKVKTVKMAEMHENITIEEALLVIKDLPYLKRWHMSLM